MSERGNPYLTQGLKARMDELIKRLRSAPKEEHKKILARFAIEFGLREEKVHEYYMQIKKAEFLETDEQGNYKPM